MSHQTRIILFKKLQREAEQAIRKADTQGVGSLSKQLLAACLCELGYLKVARPDYFTDTLWTLLNPRRTLTVKNSVIYDVLLLFTYKVSMSAPQFATAVSEYLYKMYKE